MPQLSIHRADLQGVLLAAVKERLGADAVVTGQACLGVDVVGADRVRVRLRGSDGALGEIEGQVAVGCDGIHSAVRKLLYPDEGPPRWSGVNMWRGVVPHAPFLSGASMVRAGWLTVGKMVIYPIRDDIDGRGTQLVNWVAELECAEPVTRDWNGRGRLDDFLPTFADWRFDWLDVPAMIRATETVLAYPMVDQDPLPRWSFGRITLLGDAAHPMYPRGSNGAGQAILDATCLAAELARHGVGPQALAAYDLVRNAATARVVLANPQHAARHDPARGARALGRQAVRAHRGRGLARGAGAHRPRVQAGRRRAAADVNGASMPHRRVDESTHRRPRIEGDPT